MVVAIRAGRVVLVTEEVDMGDLIQDAVAKIFMEHKSSMLVKWSFECEVLNERGEHSLHILASPDIAAWDHVGLLEYAKMHRKNMTFAHNFLADDE